MNKNKDSISEQQAATDAPHTETKDLMAQEKSKNMPFSNWWPVIAGALVGIVLRLIFSAEPGFRYAAMNNAFILLVPVAVGAVTVYIAETKVRRSMSYYILVPAFANILFVLGTMAILIEGIICAIIIAPLFAFLGAVGGLIMGGICRMTNWPRHAVYSFTVLPLIFGALPPNESGHQYIAVTERSIVIPTSAEKVWHHLHDVRDIKPDEVSHAWIYRIGVPLPISGVTQIIPEGLLRKVTMGKSIHFDQISTDWEVNRYVKWRYRFYDDSFPPKALDDHVKIGGHYFDIIDTEYILAPENLQSTKLRIRMTYRVSTQFNWYAKSVAQLLIGNFEEVIMDFYRDRTVGKTSKPS